MYLRLALVVVFGAFMTLFISYFGQANFLKADVISDDTTITGNLSVTENVDVGYDLSVSGNVWGSNSVISTKDAANYFNCPQGQYVIGVNFTNQRIKCGKL